MKAEEIAKAIGGDLNVDLEDATSTVSMDSEEGKIRGSQFIRDEFEGYSSESDECCTQAPTSKVGKKEEKKQESDEEETEQDNKEAEKVQEESTKELKVQQDSEAVEEDSEALNATQEYKLLPGFSQHSTPVAGPSNPMRKQLLFQDDGE